MDEAVVRSMAKWPNVPDVYGWLSLDRRGNWLIKGERIANAGIRDFIARNYAPDARGCWYFQNGPQRVFVDLAYTPLVVHYEDEAVFDHRGRAFAPAQAMLDDEGSILLHGEPGIALLDDRDLTRYAGREESLPTIACTMVPERYGFIRNPIPGSGPF